MTDPPDGKPTTFRADWWRFARERMGQRLRSPFRSFLTSGFARTVPFAIGGLLFGASYILDEAEEYVAELLAIVAMLALVWPVVFLFYLLTAPAAMWRRDQETILELRASLTPAPKLTFDEQCLRYVPRGRVTTSLGGHRFHDGQGSDRHVLIKCVNCSKTTVQGVQARIVDVKAPPPGQMPPHPHSFFMRSDCESLTAMRTRPLCRPREKRTSVLSYSRPSLIRRGRTKASRITIMNFSSQDQVLTRSATKRMVKTQRSRRPFW